VHIASKKAAWYSFAELEGDLRYGPENSYERRGVALRNASVTSEPARQRLIIDPGPRSLAGRAPGPGSRATPPAARLNPHFSFPPEPTIGYRSTCWVRS